MKVIFKLWPYLAILLAILTFFYPVWLKGFIPLPADFTVGAYYPWLDYKWAGYEAGVPVKNPITTDVVSFIFPVQMLAVDLMKNGVWPLWNNMILSGTPLLANFQSAPFSPTNILYFLMPKLLAWTIQIMAQLFLAAIFLYLLLRNFGVSKLASVAGGIFYGFAGFLMIWMEWNGHALVAAFFPLIILFVKKWLEEEKPLWGILFSVTLALQIFSGYPQIILYEFLSLLLLVFVFDRNIFKTPKRVIVLGFYAALGIMAAAVQILPGFELLQWSQRSVETVLNQWAFLPPEMIITFLAPDYFGNHATANYWGPADYTLTTGFSGTIVILLAMIAVVKRKNKGIIFGITLVLMALFIALPNPISVAFKESGFLGLQAASAHRALVLSNLGFAILAAFGLDLLLQRKVSSKDFIRAFYLPAIILLSFAFGTYLSIYFLKTGLGINLIGKNIVDLTVGLRNLIFPILLLGASSILILSTIKFKKWTNIFVVTLIILSIFELFRFGWKFTPFSNQKFVYPKTPVLDFLQKQQPPFRISAEDSVPINMMMPFNLETVEGYDAVYPLSYAQFLATLNSGSTTAEPMGRYGSVSNYNSKFFNIINGKFILALKRDANGNPDKNGKLPSRFIVPNLDTVFEDKTVAVIENKLVYDRAFFVSDWVSKENSKDILDSILSLDSPNKKIVLEENFNDFKQTINSKSKTEISSYGNSVIEVTTDAKDPGFLFLSQTFYPGWKATVDGVQAKIYRADYTFMAVPINSSGQHKIRVYYQPDSFKFGGILSLLSLGILCIIGIKAKYGSQS